MASEVDISNLALGYLGDDATVSSLDPPEGSAQADHCAKFYPITRDSLLEMHEWGFATRRIALADLGSDWPQWAYGYAKPNDALKCLAVLDPNAIDDADPQHYVLESLSDGSGLIYTNQENAVLRYMARVTDPTRFSPLFVEALSWLLASKLAGPVLKGETGATAAKATYKMFNTVMAQATTSDASQQHKRPEQHAPWIVAR